VGSSSLAKRYAPELGSDTVNALFASVPLNQMVTTVLTCAETFSLLIRKRNRNELDAAAYTTAASALQNEVIYHADFSVLDISFDATLAGIELIQRHNINSADAAVLTVFLRYAQATSTLGINSVLVASDLRMLRAAQVEGLPVLNPELLPAADVPTFLAAIG
jgi:hypothetical protein